MSEEKYEHQAKPTLYGGILYRSRMEARWAAFFDFLGWEYEYEPEPLETWSPDFVIHSIDAYVEVKPLRLWQSAIDKVMPYSKVYRCGIISDIVVTEEHCFYIGKIFNKDYKPGQLMLKDFRIPYYGRFNAPIVDMLWKEAKNKTMYLNPMG